MGNDRGASIEGVRLTDLRLHLNERGRLMEVQRDDDPEFPGFGQVYVTQTFSGIVKAWYLHRTQIDQIAVISGTAMLVLYDARAGSPTLGLTDEILLDGQSPRLVQIPPGLWHGFKAIGPEHLLLLHLNSRAFDLETPDEEKRSPDDPSIPYRW